MLNFNIRAGKLGRRHCKSLEKSRGVWVMLVTGNDKWFCAHLWKDLPEYHDSELCRYKGEAQE